MKADSRPLNVRADGLVCADRPCRPWGCERDLRSGQRIHVETRMNAEHIGTLVRRKAIPLEVNFLFHRVGSGL